MKMDYWRHTLIITSGYFDPPHVGHIEYLTEAKRLEWDSELLVIVNNDQQAILKKGKSFMPEDERVRIIESIRGVDIVRLSTDTDLTVCHSLRSVKKIWTANRYIFAKGGDRFSTEIPEAGVCKELGIEIVDGLGDKIQSSSELVKKAAL